jgi:phage terminase large subunit-like protein
MGCEIPRIFTPPLRELTPETSLGFAVIEFATDVLDIDLRPWQRWLLIHALELTEDGQFRFRTVVVLVARQNGKSLLSNVLALFYMYVLGTALVLGTAQDLDVAEEIWQSAVDLVEDTPQLDALKQTVVKAAGKKALVLKTGERYKVKAANRRAGRGLSGDHPAG